MSFEESPEGYNEWLEDRKKEEPILYSDCGKTQYHPPHLFSTAKGKCKSCNGFPYKKAKRHVV